MTYADEPRNFQVVVKFVQELLLHDEDGAVISPVRIADKMNLVLAMQPDWGKGLDKTAVMDELIRRFSMWIGKDATLKNERDHEAWLSAARKQDWRYWQRYREWLEGKLSWKAVDALDRSTDTILGLLEDPLRTGVWDRRGLVVGHVQSGKTGNYTGLICKAADAGYKIIIVLAGTHNNLRSQTQIRLDEGFLGFATNPNPDVVDFIGVGKGGRDAHIRPNCATNRSDGGDFGRKVAKHLAISPEQRPWLFVVKKNRTVLKLLLDWIRNHAADAVDPKTGRKTVTRLPLLVIDDEADHASVDTGEQLFDEDGQPDEEHQPKAINGLIRKVLHAFSRSAFVGYTATPFANIFIHERGATQEEGPDLFPAAFIVNLAAPSNYVGPARVFGLTTSEGRRNGLPLVRHVADQEPDVGEAWMPPHHKNGHRPRHAGRDELPTSLVEAIDAFLLACSARQLRGQARDHSSMLVHVTRYTSVQGEVHRQVAEHVRQMRQRITRGIDVLEVDRRLRDLWDRDFAPTTDELMRRFPDEQIPASPTWEEVRQALMSVLDEIDVRMINGKARDALEFDEYAAQGLKVIAIGGDKLARGLTLEGLCCSYFLRASKMYDTLMQMGRWFGYRRGYLDLCRLYTTRELTTWFGHIADAAEELREEFNQMAARGATPREYGLKVQSHPVLMVTSQLKMRSARNLKLSFSGELLETVALFRDPEVLSTNLETTRRFIQGIDGPDEQSPSLHRGDGVQRWPGANLWKDVPADSIVGFLADYRTHPAAYKVNSAMLSEFVRSLNSVGELTRWTVLLAGGGTGSTVGLAPGIEIRMGKRSADPQIADRYSIGRLLDPKDESVDLDGPQWEAALSLTRASWKPDPARKPDARPPDEPNGPSIRRIRGFGAPGIPAHPERGLLILYVLDPEKAGPVSAPVSENVPPIVAFGISFPGSDSGVKVEYKVNNVLWEQEYGPAE